MELKGWYSATLLTAIAVTLGACGGGESGPPSAPAPAPPTLPAQNSPPRISGTPAPVVPTGSPYSFQPSASDPDGDTLAFSISGKPAWAIFSAATGSLSGTPTAADAGTYANIVIRVSDGLITQALPAFSIRVTPAAATGTATLYWIPPTQNTDGSPLSYGDLSGYRVYHGTRPDRLEVAHLVSGNATTYTVQGLHQGTHYFALSALSVAGVESALSGVGSKTIP